MAFFDSHQGAAPAAPQMDQRQMQAMAQRELDDFGKNIDRYIDKSGIDFPPEIRGNVPAMCRWMIENRRVPAQNMRIAQPLINRLFGRR